MLLGLPTLIHVTKNKDYFVIQYYWIAPGRYDCMIASISYALCLCVQWETNWLCEYFGYEAVSLGYCFPKFSKESCIFIF
jgi:hypothetical protein